LEKGHKIDLKPKKGKDPWKKGERKATATIYQVANEFE